MVSMHAFYTNLSTTEEFLRIAQASLNEILAVRSELAWDIWGETK
jgi:hypothetical protein